MADSLRVLGQLAPGTVLSALYTVPGATSTSVSSIVVCNRAAASATFRISVAVANAADSPTQYLYYDQVLAGNSTYIATIGISLATTDVIRVYASAGTVSFTAFGVEVTA